MARTRQVIDLPPPVPVEVVEHQVIERSCPHCAAWKPPPLDRRGQVFDQGRIGVRVAVLVAYVHTVRRLPIRRIQEYLAPRHGLNLSSGDVTRFRHQVRVALDDDREQIKAQARAVLDADETGWCEDGHQGSIWAFSTPGDEVVRSYEDDPSRGGKRILGGSLTGHLVRDCSSGYNSYPGTHQRCRAHLLRDLPDQPQEGEPLAVTVHRWCRAVRARYDDAQEHPHAPQEAREAAYMRLVNLVHALGMPYAQMRTHPGQAHCKRRLRHEDEVFQCVLVAGLNADNTQAERRIRALVIIRTISGGSRSKAGTKTRMGFASLFGTWVARGLNAFHEGLHRLAAPTPSPA